jgi:hypothetical protein
MQNDQWTQSANIIQNINKSVKFWSKPIMPKPKQLSSSPHPAVKAIVLYDNFASGAKASTVLRRTARQAGGTKPCSIRPWRVDLLKVPLIAEESLIEAASAHLIVFAGRFVQAPPIWLLAWLKQWAVSRQNHHVALAIIGHQDANLPPIQVPPELSQFAKVEGLNFIFDDDFVIKNWSELLASHLKAQKLPYWSTLPQTNDLKIQGLNCHWGINE